MSHDAIVIVGSGMAGVTLARELRRLDKEAPLLMVTANDGSFYPKPGISNALAAGKAPAQLVLTPGIKLAEQLQLQLHANARVLAIDAGGKLLHTDRGDIPYARLVLASGAHPLRLPLQGNAAHEVLSVNHLDDYQLFRARLEGKRKVAILGAGLIGCEFANDLCSAGYAVEVFDIAPQALGRLLPPLAAQFYRMRLEQAGVRFHFATAIAAVDKLGQGYRLTAKNGEQYEADVVLSAIGLAPALELAQSAGLATRRGIVVDRMLQSSNAQIYALGDCAEVEGLVLPFVLPIMQCARALAATLAGTPTPVHYPAMPVAVKTPACPVAVSPPAANAQGAWVEEESAEGVRALYKGNDGSLLGFALLGEAAKERQALTPALPTILA